MNCFGLGVVSPTYICTLTREAPTPIVIPAFLNLLVARAHRSKQVGRIHRRRESWKETHLDPIST